jgi:chromosome partitioning protein
MNYLVEQARYLNPGLRAYIFVNRASPNPLVVDAKEAQEIASEFENLKIIKTVIRERVAFQRSVRGGLSVAEVPSPDAKAVFEIRSFYKEVYDHEQT